MYYHQGRVVQGDLIWHMLEGGSVRRLIRAASARPRPGAGTNLNPCTDTRTHLKRLGTNTCSGGEDLGSVPT